MTDHGAQELGTSYTCREPNCTADARSDRGPYSRCDFHRKQREQNGDGAAGPAPARGGGARGAA